MVTLTQGGIVMKQGIGLIVDMTLVVGLTEVAVVTPKETYPTLTKLLIYKVTLILLQTLRGITNGR